MTDWQILFLLLLTWLMVWAGIYIWLNRKKQPAAPLLHSPDPLAGDAALGMAFGAHTRHGMDLIVGSPAVNEAVPTWPTYAVGDPALPLTGNEICWAEDIDGYICTLDQHHDGPQHVASGLSQVMAVWSAR